MKYNININQFAVIREGFDLDIIDMAIFDYIIFLGTSPKTIRTKDYNGKEFFRVRHKTIIENMPLLGIKSEQAIQRRIEKLIKEGLLEKFLQEGNRTFYCFGKNFNVFFKKDTLDINNKEKFLNKCHTKNNKKYQLYGYVYIIESQGLYKIGCTSNIDNRKKRYITENPNEINFILGIRIKEYEKIEKELHKKFSKKRVRGEWFKLTNNDIENIRNNYKETLILN